MEIRIINRPIGNTDGCLMEKEVCNKTDKMIKKINKQKIKKIIYST